MQDDDSSEDENLKGEIENIIEDMIVDEVDEMESQNKNAAQENHQLINTSANKSMKRIQFTTSIQLTPHLPSNNTP